MQADILLVTVNPHEDEQLKKIASNHGCVLRPYQDEESLIHYVDFNKVNNQHVVLVQSEMGSFLDGASYTTVKRALADLQPQLVICVGIAWGGHEETQQIGDILISNQIQLGSNTKIGEDFVKFRGPRPPASWEATKSLRLAASRLGYTTHVGTILSKEDLFDNKSLRDKSINACDAIGGEMEALGVYKAIEEFAREFNQHVDYAVVKSICDWGYRKNINANAKERDQKLAAANAAHVVLEALQSYRFVKSSLLVHFDDRLTLAVPPPKKVESWTKRIVSSSARI